MAQSWAIYKGDFLKALGARVEENREGQKQMILLEIIGATVVLTFIVIGVNHVISKLQFSASEKRTTRRKNRRDGSRDIRDRSSGHDNDLR